MPDETRECRIIRIAASILLFCSLAACTVAPLVEPKLANSMRVLDVTVDASSFSWVPDFPFEKNLGKGRAQVEADLEGALRRELVQASRTGTVPVVMDFRIESIQLHSAASWNSAHVYSQIWSKVQIRHARSGEVLLAEQGFLGDDNVGSSTLNSVVVAGFGADKSFGQAYDDVVVGFASDFRRTIFEFDSQKALAQ